MGEVLRSCPPPTTIKVAGHIKQGHRLLPLLVKLKSVTIKQESVQICPKTFKQDDRGSTSLLPCAVTVSSCRHIPCGSLMHPPTHQFSVVFLSSRPLVSRRLPGPRARISRVDCSCSSLPPHWPEARSPVLQVQGAQAAPTCLSVCLFSPSPSSCPLFSAPLFFYSYWLLLC